MIKDPTFWRKDLVKIADQLERRQRQVRWNYISFSRTEQAVMTAFYGIRKMLEAKKASSTILAASVRIVEYPPRLNFEVEIIGPVLGAYFDLDHPKELRRKLLFVCHQVVHSYIFSVAVGYSTGFEGIYFASDRLRNKCVFFIPAPTLIDLFRTVGMDPDAPFAPWIEERLPYHRVQTAFPQPESWRFQSDNKMSETAK